MINAVQEVQRQGQSVWYDNIRRGLIKSGELKRLIDLGVSGLTSNPTIFQKAIAGSSDYDDALLKLAREGRTVLEAYEELTLEDIRSAADLLREEYDRTDGADGFASLEVNPHLAHDTEGTVEEGRRLFAELDRPNVMIKVPATPEGVPAVRRLIGEGINVNVTLTFSLDAYRRVRDAYLSGLEDLQLSGGDVGKIGSVASFFVSRVDTAADSLIEEKDGQDLEEVKDLLGKAAIANAKLAYRDFQDDFGARRFEALRAGGARVQRPLWASTSTKNPDYSDVMYVEQLIGPDTVDTMPEATLVALLEHGRVARTLDRDVEEAEQVFESLQRAGISMEEITASLLQDGVRLFTDSYDELLKDIEAKQTQLVAGTYRRFDGSLGPYSREVDSRFEELAKADLPERIWRKDPAVWRATEEQIGDRLGWLDVTSAMRAKVPELEDFAEEVRDSGFRHVVLLGMGGSSMGPEVLRQAFGSADGYPEFIVLDSTVPSAVQAVTDVVDAGRTLFLVSSKSGSTIEPNALYRHFRTLVDEALGHASGGGNFAAVTDPGTSLEALADKRGFRRVFLNPPDIGGRYSVLSYFGLVPAALMGLDLNRLLARTDAMRHACGAGEAGDGNPGAWLGAAFGSMAAAGRDKLTLITSPGMAGFGLWAEQLIAESLGKGGLGIVPVTGEPVLAPDHYGDDRLFVYIQLEGNDNGTTDAAVSRLEASGQPVVRLDLKDRYDLGAEFFRWEFATAVAGSMLGVNPFDQPDVEQAKQQTQDVLQEYTASGERTSSAGDSSLTDLLSSVGAGDYLAVLSYVRPTPGIDKAVVALRRAVAERYRIATTAAYGPRYLHSTGQLHKGGLNTGLFLILSEQHSGDLAVPGEAYTFGALADAQAAGDLQVLSKLGRRVASLAVGPDVAGDIGRLAAEVSQA